MSSKFIRDLREWTKSILIAAILAILIHTFLFAVVVVSGPSMEPTLHNNERLILNKIVYDFSEPQRGDIIVFHANKQDDYIKRVIGLPNEKVEFKDNKLYINDQLIEEDYLNNTRTDDVSPVVVPEGTIYVLGDNRLNSTDSRILGPISLDQVVGRVKLQLWPLNELGLVK